MPNAINSIIAAAWTALTLSACSDGANSDQNLVITNEIPADAEIETVPADEGGAVDETGGGDNLADANAQ